MRFSPLQVISTGICCSVGYTAPAAVAAIRAGMDHFRETQFVDRQGKALLGAQLYQNENWGPDRLDWMLYQAINECLSNFEIPLSRLYVILVLPEKSRPGMSSQWLEQVYHKVKTRFHENTIVLYGGKAGIGQAVEQANRILKESNEITTVMIAGVDSYFTSETIHHYLIEERLMTEVNSDGFIPGEAASAILLQRHYSGSPPGLHILGYGIAYEEAHILQTEKKMKAIGLSEAINQAVDRSERLLSQTQFRMSDVSGETFYFRESTLALTRCMDRKVPEYPHFTLSTKLGEVGAASGVLMLSYLHHAMQISLSNGISGLLHFSADAGERAALIVQYNNE